MAMDKPSKCNWGVSQESRAMPHKMEISETCHKIRKITSMEGCYLAQACSNESHPTHINLLQVNKK